MSDTSEEKQILNPLLEYHNSTTENLETLHNLKEEPMKNVEKKDNLTAEEKFKLMKEIEIKTENKMKELYETGQLIHSFTPESTKTLMDLLEQTMQVGANEFKEKMGRNMSYSEMRMMFG